MSDEEFVRFADGMVGWDLYKEALVRLERRLQDAVEVSELEKSYEREIDDLNDEIGILESRIDELVAEREYS
jgi:hypothetical protein